MATTEMTAGWMKLASWPACETLERDIARNELRGGEDMAEDDALFQKGMPIRREVLVPAGDYRLGMGLGLGGWNTRPKDPQFDEPGDAHCLKPGA